MGFRSNFITESYSAIYIPKWFSDKYPDYSYQKDIDGKNTFAIAQLWESKYYGELKTDERLLDIQKVLIETNKSDIVLVLLHECGGITRVKITQDTIIARIPKEWEEVEGIGHDYCYFCSD